MLLFLLVNSVVSSAFSVLLIMCKYYEVYRFFLLLFFFFLYDYFFFFFFFFQAEDGIRDRNVTGVQTCALPISAPFTHGSGERFDAITSDPLDPWVKGAAMLYTKEFFETARAHLNPGGVMTLLDRKSVV